MIETLISPANLHGEGPIWHSGRQSIFWVDILSSQIIAYSWDRKELTSYPDAPLVSAVFEIEGQRDTLIAVLQGGIARYELTTNSYQIINDLNLDWKETRGNDGAVDPSGNIWFSTTHVDHLEEQGDLYCLLSNGVVKKVLERVSISNGPCWSPDTKTMFHTDSSTRVIKSYLLENHLLKEASQQVLISENEGFPDGMAMDRNGVLWVAIWGGFAIHGYDMTSGRLVSKIDLPVPNVSSCAFVGPNLDYLFITSSRKGLSDLELKQYPESGRTFLVPMETSGVETSVFKKNF